MNKKLSLFILCAAFLIGAFLVLDAWHFEKLSVTTKLQQLWEEDMELMEETRQLPKVWSSIREIELIPGSEEAKTWLKNLVVPVVVDKNGDFKLQVLFVPWEEEGKQAVFIQYDLVDLKSPYANTVFETSRTIIISDENSWIRRWMNQNL